MGIIYRLIVHPRPGLQGKVGQCGAVSVVIVVPHRKEPHYIVPCKGVASSHNDPYYTDSNAGKGWSGVAELDFASEGQRIEGSVPFLTAVLKAYSRYVIPAETPSCAMLSVLDQVSSGFNIWLKHARSDQWHHA